MTTTLTLTSGSLAASRSASDANATAVLTPYIEATHGPVDGTAQEKLEHVLAQLEAHILHVARQHSTRKAARVAREAAQADSGSLTWSE